MEYELDSLGQAVHISALGLLTAGQIVSTSGWQGLKAIRSEFDTFEITNWNFSAPVVPSLDSLREMIKPNLPWADDHFLERIGEEPLNPGVQYQNWPYYTPGSFKKGDKFTHTYMERFWPKFAEVPMGSTFGVPRNGIRYPYGDLNDVVDLLLRDPLTRQAYFPIWFPEDTGAVHGGRVPCTLGYYFLCRNNKLHIFYSIRSCDLFRHFQDDLYLACRLLHWVYMKLENEFWSKVGLGSITMNIYSLHIFASEVDKLRDKILKGEL